MKKEKSVLAWHFVGKTLRDGQPIPRNGKWLIHKGDCIMCESGLHASRRLIDALCYAPGETLCRVECQQIESEQDDKLVCRHRKIIARVDATDLLWRASRKFALDMVHLWDAPEVVVKYLKTGDESLRGAAGAAAREAAWAAARDAARAAAWDAARATARDAARAAAWAAARDAAWDAALATAWAAARATAWAAARDAAWDAALATAWAAAREAQNKWLTKEARKLLKLGRGQ